MKYVKMEYRSYNLSVKVSSTEGVKSSLAENAEPILFLDSYFEFLMKEQQTIFKSAWKLGGWDAWRLLRADEELIKILTSIVKRPN